MKSPDKWRAGWDAFLKRKTKGLSKVDLRLIRQLQVEYIGMIQKDARNEKDQRLVRPIGPSSDDFQHWMCSRPAMKARIEAMDVNEHVAYEIWRSAWLACEREHKIRV